MVHQNRMWPAHSAQTTGTWPSTCQCPAVLTFKSKRNERTVQLHRQRCTPYVSIWHTTLLPAVIVLVHYAQAVHRCTRQHPLTSRQRPTPHLKRDEVTTVPPPCFWAG
jgi:hypothetical protein